MNAEIHTLLESEFYHIKDFKCHCSDCAKSDPEYSETFCISFVRKGNFLFNVFRHSLDSYTGCVLITKPGYERTVTHVHTIPDECTIFEFKDTFYAELLQQYENLNFLLNNDCHATLLKINPDIELLHYQILQHVAHGAGDKLLVDNLVMELVETVLGKITEYKPDFDIYDSDKQNHLATIERAKAYIADKFQDNISLSEIADHAHVSPFHFSRLFKRLTSWSPHQFLLSVRLKYAEILLRNTDLPVSDVAFSSGFNSIEHFSYAFRNRYKTAPINLRKTPSFSKKS
jgi:AraC family transcriptional regulator